YGMSDAFALDRLAKALRAESGNRHLVGAESRSGEQEWEVDDVKHWRRVQINGAFPVRHPVVQTVDVLEDIGMTQHDTLGTAGCAGGEDGGEVGLGVVDGLATGIAGYVQLFCVDPPLPRRLQGGDGQRRVANQAAGSCIAQHVTELHRRKPRVEWDRD